MYQKQSEGWWKHWDFFLLDIIGLQLAFFLAELFVLQLRNVHYHDIYRTEALLLFLCVFVHAFLTNPYKGILRRSFGTELTRILYSAVYMGLLDVVFLYFLHVAVYLSRYVLGVTWVLYVVIAAAGRFLLKKAIAYRRKTSVNRSVMVVTSREYASAVLSSVKAAMSDPGAVIQAGVYFAQTDSAQGGPGEQPADSAHGGLGAQPADSAHGDSGEQPSDSTHGSPGAQPTLQEQVASDISVLSAKACEETGHENVPEEHYEIRGNEADALSYATHNWVDEVYLYLPGNSALEQSLSRKFIEMGIIVHRLMETLAEPETITDQILIERSGRNVFLTYTVRSVSLPELLVKRLIDLVGGFVGCILTGILFLFIAPLIYAASPGPVIFSQTRVGRNGKPFRMYKFRSMYPDAEARKAALQKENKSPDGYMFKVEDDPRIIGSEKKRRDGKPGGIGNFIRRTSIDEFPQFWNVLRGDMSLVGTRPPTLDEWEKYSPNHRARMATRPGITGMWQVNGRNEVMDFEEVVKLDMEYIRNWSLLLDVKILARTVLVAVRGSGAA